MLTREGAIAIVGAGGVIGTVAQEAYAGRKILPLGRETDARDYDSLVKTFHNADTVVHLALNPNSDIVHENFRKDTYDPDNSFMSFNVYKAALDAGVHRVIMASSVHADNFYVYKSKKLLSADHMPTPDSPYGANKLFMEFLGKYFATKGLEVICIRFGGVNAEDVQPQEHFEHIVWLSQSDCRNMLRACVDIQQVPNRFAVFYAVSNNSGRIHDTSNPVGWIPQKIYA